MHKPVAACLAFVALAITAASPAAESLPDTPRSFDAVAKVAAVTARDGNGHAQRFTDFRNREFAISRDAQQRVQSVGATRGLHFSDIVSIGYSPSGEIVGAKFRSGYALFFDIRPNGTQIIRDSQGGALQRTGRTTQPLQEAGAEQTAKLATVIIEFESLLTSLGQPTK